MKYRGRITHTFAELEISREAYNEIYALLANAGYHHAFVDGDRVIDMHGIGLTKGKSRNEESKKGEEDNKEGEATTETQAPGLGMIAPVAMGANQWILPYDDKGKQ